MKKNAVLLRFWEELAGILFPRKCPVCDDIILPRGALICPPCRKKVVRVGDRRCFHCGRPIPDADAEYCSRCRTDRSPFERGIALMEYDKTARKILLDLKYRGKRDNADYVAAEIEKSLGRELARIPAQVLVPVPISEEKNRIRGFNQAALLAERLSERIRVPARTDLLMRKKDTAPLMLQEPGQRRKSLSSAFSVSGAWPEELKNVILVDDIYTTGATARACTKALLSAGAERVWVLCAAAAKDR